MPAQSITGSQATLASTLWPEKSAGGVLRFVALALVGTALMAISAKIKVELLYVPMTMQTLVVLVLGAAYGWRLGAATMLLYILEGAAGLPVFTNTPPQIASPIYLLGPTGGYLVGFVLAAALIGALAERGWDRSLPRLFVAMAIGHVVILACGLAWLTYLMGIEKAWLVGVVPFYWATLIKTALGAAVMPLAWALVPRKEI